MSYQDHEDDDDGDDVREYVVERVAQETDKAILVVLAETGDQRWVPKSVIHDDSEVFDRAHADGRLIVQAWFAIKNWGA